MRIPQISSSMNMLIYVSIFLVTQITGVLLCLIVSFILQDFSRPFINMAISNSFILSLGLVGSCYLTQKLMLRLKIVYTILTTLSLLLGISLISFFYVLYSAPTLFVYYDRGAFSCLVINFLFVLTLYAISSLLIIYREIMLDKEKTIGAERTLRKQTELQLLSSRVNPHFLFNTLNLILTLLKHPQKAETAILNLSDLLRHNLEQSAKPFISTTEEIGNVRKYLELQVLRFGDKLRYKIDEDTSFPMPPLIIQPLVENSIKHNMKAVSQLSIEISLKKDHTGNKISVIDSEKKLTPAMLVKGRGLDVTRKRVENCGGAFSVINGGVEIWLNT